MNENIVKLEYLEKEIYLVKTAHVSRNSVEDVRECIEEVQPDAICVELDQDRYNKLKEPEKWRNTDIVKVIKEKQVGFLLVNVILCYAVGDVYRYIPPIPFAILYAVLAFAGIFIAAKSCLRSRKG